MNTLDLAATLAADVEQLTAPECVCSGCRYCLAQYGTCCCTHLPTGQRDRIRASR